jgi:iron complex outermembrane receptor protein
MKSLYYRSALIFIFITGTLLTGQEAHAQSDIEGTISDRDSNPLLGATVTIKGTNTYAVADSNGKFKISSQEKLPFSLLVRALGYTTQEVEVYELSGESFEVSLLEDNILNGVTISARRRLETVQEVPIAVSVIKGAVIEQAGAFNVNRIKELIPSVQLYSSNPRNTGINIRGLGSPFGLTNDGLDPGVGFYVDGVYFARPAAATFDFIDIDQIEVLRGPQGTLFGKNTTAGAFNITTRKASFTPSADFEVSYGNYGFIQAKSSLTGPLSKKIAGRLSFSGTQRDGVIENVATGKYINDINNIGARGQLLFRLNAGTAITLSGDASRQRPDGYAQVVAGVVETKRAAYRQFNAIISDLNYTLPSNNAFDRKIDHDTPWQSNNDLGGASLNVDTQLGPGTLTSTTAFRYWKWDPSNDRDFTGLQALAKSQNPSKHHNWSQEIRYAGDFSSRLGGVVGLFYIDQQVKTNGTEESGDAQWRFSQSTTSSLWATPGLFEGYGISTKSSIASQSAAAFANLDWTIVSKLHLMGGVRFNWDHKAAIYDRKTYGGLDTTDPALLALKKLVYTDQAYDAHATERNFTYMATLAYQAASWINAYATYSTAFKPVGVNVAGIPTISGQPALELAQIKPEYVNHLEAGIKTTPTDNLTLNFTAFNTDIRDYQTNVQSPELGVNRGYIANAEKVNVKGLELDVNLRAGKNFTFFGAASYTDGKYVTFTNAPLPLEETGLTVDGVQVAFKDISGERLPGISRWATTVGGEFSTPVQAFGQSGRLFVAFDTYYRSEFSSSPSPSAFLNIDGYALLNARAGFRVSKGTSVSLWARNLLNKNYYEQLLVAGGNAGHYAGVLGDPRTFGVTLKHSF